MVVVVREGEGGAEKVLMNARGMLQECRMGRRGTGGGRGGV